MYFNKERMRRLLREYGMSLGEFAHNLGLPISEAREIICGERAASYRQSAWLLAYFGIWEIVSAMRERECAQYMHFAIEAVLNGDGI